MARRVAVSTLNASTIDILNVIRQNATAEYQSLVPVVATENDIPKVGEVLFGYPALANQFINALINRIAAVRVKSAVFNNAYAELKKGYLEFGQTVEEVFVNIVKAKSFSAEKAEGREFKRNLPDVRSAFHVMNWRVLYPVTIQDEDLRMAFLSMDGVQDLIARIVDAVYTAAEYDEFLLFKYLIIKAVAHGKMYPVSVDGANLTNAAAAYRGVSNMLTFMRSDYNEAGVKTSTPRDDQYIFLDAMYDGRFDTEVLASAFNMDKAMYMGHRKLIDDWTTFDNDRFSEIMAESDQIEPVTGAELALMADVIGVLVDGEFFQVYDNNNKFTEKYVASGLYWNYFYHVWKTISTSPFSNAVVFVKNTATTTLPATVTYVVDSVNVSDDGYTLTLSEDPANTVAHSAAIFTQTRAATVAGIAIHKYGAVIAPDSQKETALTLELTIDGTTYTAGTAVTAATEVGTEIEFTR